MTTPPISASQPPHAPTEPAGPTDPEAARPRAADLLITALAADAVRRDPRVLAGPLDHAAPWARALPPAAWRQFAEEVATTLCTAAADPGPELEAQLRRWSAVAARFEERGRFEEDDRFDEDARSTRTAAAQG